MLSCHSNGLAFARGVALLVALGVGFLLGPAACRADTPPYYMKVREFEIPYASDADQNLKQVHLFVSTDRKTYSAIASTALRKGAFPYTAKADGEYFFVVQVEDSNGTLRPPRPELAEPTCRIIVDTQKPQVAFRAVQPKQGRAAVEWRITDPNLDLRTLRLEAKGPGETAWTPHQITLLQAAQFGWNPVGNGPIEVRLFVKDLAGNEATATTQVTPSAGSIPAPGGTDSAQVQVRQAQEIPPDVHDQRGRPFQPQGSPGLDDARQVAVVEVRDRAGDRPLRDHRPDHGPLRLHAAAHQRRRPGAGPAARRRRAAGLGGGR